MVARPDNFRSGLEKRAAEQLEAAGRPYRYEKIVIPYIKPAKKARYIPDFAIEKSDGSLMFIETKGLFATADRQKHLLVRAEYPDKDIRIVFQNANQRISKLSKTTYAKWATDHGIKWSDKGIIPKEWLDE